MDFVPLAVIRETEKQYSDQKPGNQSGALGHTGKQIREHLHGDEKSYGLGKQK